MNITKKIGACSQNLVKKARHYLTNRYCNNKVSKLNVEFSFITHTMNLALLNFKFIPLFKQGWFEVIAFTHVLVFVKMLLLISKVTGITFHGKMVPNKRGNVSYVNFNLTGPALTENLAIVINTSLKIH